ncbi:sugar porter family MFS transporter [Litoribacter alkaliphilus]|uniref:Sugar porter family MFS transporter n=1 Tax=Litoribacter ruber TaxID=702568 RepID=A0AAP2G5K5_9BACT|nr:sugar porter family MFS transporter [Litoribacter alkaliphilus]MBS9525635.1 sugar porter family MFS transporter [Litoribacter alkaliphilus]
MQKTQSVVSITVVVTLGGLLFGFDMAVISGVLPFVQEQFSLTAAEEGWFVSSALVGCILGVILSGEGSDRWGRKKLLMAAAFLFLISAIGSALSESFFLLILSRLIGGVGVGIASSVSPLYISEIAPAHIRGKLVTFYQLAITVGILVAYLTNSAILNFSVGNSGEFQGDFINYFFVDELWRSMMGLGVIPSLIYLIGLLYVPESPRWLILNNRIEEGEEILSRLGGKENARRAVEGIVRSLNQEKGSYRELFAPGLRIALLIGLLLPLFSQFSGINAVIYFGPRILSDAGIDMSNAFLGQIFFGVANLVFTLFAIWKVDKLGRRPLYLIGSLGASMSLALIGLCFYLKAAESIFLLVSIILFIACFAFSIGPLKFVIASEIFPNKIRGRAIALSIMVMWIADAIIGQLTPLLLAFAGPAYTFWIFASFCLMAFIVVFKLVPETKGKSLEEIQQMWSSKEKEKKKALVL